MATRGAGIYAPRRAQGVSRKGDVSVNPVDLRLSTEWTYC
jgi:hypothetical protein